VTDVSHGAQQAVRADARLRRAQLNCNNVRCSLGHVDDSNPEWLMLGEELMEPVILMTLETLRSKALPDGIRPLPELALYHHIACTSAGYQANLDGRHSVAMCLVRQSVEALTIVEIGVHPEAFAAPLLDAWQDGQLTQGELRQRLERGVWPAYGIGLWSESWAEFAGNLARAVQPYAHYTPQLLGWQYQMVTMNADGRGAVAIGPNTYDPLKASRVTLLHTLLIWVLGRVLLAAGTCPVAVEREASISLLGRALSQSKLLFKGGEWWSQLSPHMWFKPGHDWRDT